jgi:hypothetical protein
VKLRKPSLVLVVFLVLLLLPPPVFAPIHYHVTVQPEVRHTTTEVVVYRGVRSQSPISPPCRREDAYR